MSNKDKKNGKLPARPLVASDINTPAEHDLSHQRDIRCVPITLELIKLIANMENLPVGSHVNEKDGKSLKAYVPAVKAFMEMLIEKDVQVLEVAYIFTLVRQAFQFVQDSIDETLNQNMNRITELVYDLPLNDSDTVTVRQLNEVVIRKDKLLEAWKPILDKPIEIKENESTSRP